MINNYCIKISFLFSSNIDKILFVGIGSRLTNFEIPQILDINLPSAILACLEIYRAIVSSYIISTIGQKADRPADNK